MLDWFKRGDVPSSNAGIYEYYRQEAEKFDGCRPSVTAGCGCAFPKASGIGTCCC
jgi:hypothetical protein